MLVRSALALGLLLTVLGACAQKTTEIVVFVDTDLTVPTEIDELGLWVDYATPRQRVVDLSWDLDRNKTGHIVLPARIALFPGADPARVIEVTVRGLRGQALRVDRRALLPFAQDRILFLRMNLLRRCVAAQCPKDQTCGESGCEPIAKDPGKLPDYSPEEERKRVDAGPAPDAPRPDHALPDGKQTDGPRPDAKPVDGPKPDAKPVDGPKPDAKPVDGPMLVDQKAKDGATVPCGTPTSVGLTVSWGDKIQLALDPQGAPHAFRVTSAQIEHRALVGSTWQTQTSFVPTATSISAGAATIDGQGRVHVAYLGGTMGWAYHHYRVPPATSWVVPTSAFYAQAGMQAVEIAAQGSDVYALLAGDDGYGNAKALRVGLKFGGSSYSYVQQTGKSVDGGPASEALRLTFASGLVASSVGISPGSYYEWLVQRSAPFLTAAPTDAPAAFNTASHVAVAVDGQDVHLAYTDDPSMSGTNQVVYQVWSSSGTLSGTQQIAPLANSLAVELVIHPLTKYPQVVYQARGAVPGFDTLYLLTKGSGGWPGAPTALDHRPQGNLALGQDLRVRVASHPATGKLHVLYVRPGTTSNDLYHVCVP